MRSTFSLTLCLALFSALNAGAQNGAPVSMREIEDRAKKSAQTAKQVDWNQYQADLARNWRAWSDNAQRINSDNQTLRSSARKYLNDNFYMLPRDLLQEYVEITGSRVRWQNASIERNNAWVNAMNLYAAVQYNNRTAKFDQDLGEEQKQANAKNRQAAATNYNQLLTELKQARDKEARAIDDANQQISAFNQQVKSWNQQQRELAEIRAAAATAAERSAAQSQAPQIGTIRHLNPH